MRYASTGTEIKIAPQSNGPENSSPLYILLIVVGEFGASSRKGDSLRSSLHGGSNFLLSKWYMDCVSEDGGAFIGYAATLRWGRLSLNYSSVLRHEAHETTVTNSTLQEFTAPDVAGSLIKWSSARLDCAGTWEADALPVRRTLLDSADGRIEWNCLHPRADAEVTFGQGRKLAGLGYVEHLTMTIPPWRLPFEELRWGRFLSGEDALVWINWRGGHSLNLSFHNGACVEEARLTDHEYEAGGVSLNLHENTVLRDGPLVETALATIPGVRSLFPFRILRTRESKWLGRGVLREHGAERGGGWAIHEVVRWPAPRTLETGVPHAERMNGFGDLDARDN